MVAAPGRRSVRGHYAIRDRPAGRARGSVLLPPLGEGGGGRVVGVGEGGPRVLAGRQVGGVVLGELGRVHRVGGVEGGVDVGDAEAAGVDPGETVDGFGQLADVDRGRERRLLRQVRYIG